MIPYGRQEIIQDDIDAVTKILQGDFLTQGPVLHEFENMVSNYCGSSCTVAVNSATSALHVACLALELGAGDLLWTSPNSFVASANCALYFGAKVDFVDIDPATYNMSNDHDERISLQNTLASLAPLMKESDLAIGAAGATTWERCCLGLPSLVITVADNQKAVAEELGRRGLIKYLGHHDSFCSSSLCSAVEECFELKSLDDWSKDCMDLVDGLGTRRVCSTLMQQDYGDRITFDNRKAKLASNLGDV